jgi:MFS superfamily sulfate permease-like transporter
VVIAGELTLGVLQGIAVGVVLSLLLLIYRASHPHGAVLGQLPGTEAYRYVGRHPEAVTFPGLLIWRIGGDLFFASIGHVEEGLQAALAANRAPTEHVLLDAESVNFIDASASEELVVFLKKLSDDGITVSVVRARDSVRERMRLAGIEAVVGETDFHDRITEGVQAWQQRRGLGSPSVIRGA